VVLTVALGFVAVFATESLTRRRARRIGV